LAWEFLSFYKLPKETVKVYLLGILYTPGLNVADRDLILQALAWFVEKNVDIIDAYNAAWLQEHDLTTIATFDTSHFKRFEQLTVKEPG
jgi:predicted nucleic acid-binding protein